MLKIRRGGEEKRRGKDVKGWNAGAAFIYSLKCTFIPARFVPFQSIRSCGSIPMRGKTLLSVRKPVRQRRPFPPVLLRLLLPPPPPTFPLGHRTEKGKEGVVLRKGGRKRILLLHLQRRRKQPLWGIGAPAARRPSQPEAQSTPSFLYTIQQEERKPPAASFSLFSSTIRPPSRSSEALFPDPFLPQTTFPTFPSISTCIPLSPLCAAAFPSLHPLQTGTIANFGPRNRGRKRSLGSPPRSDQRRFSPIREKR